MIRSAPAPFTGGLLLLLSLGLFSGCDGSGGGSPPPENAEPTSRSTPKNQLTQTAFADCAAFKDFYAGQLTKEYLTGYAYGGGCFGCAPEAVDGGNGEDDGGADAGADAPALSPENNGGRTVTETNTQEAGVDEADLVEADPTTADLYFLRRDANEVVIIDSSDPSAPAIRSRISLDSERRARGMYLDVPNRRLVVLLEAPFFYLEAPAVSAGIAATDVAAGNAFGPAPFAQGTELQFYDVTTPDAPVRVQRFISDGQLVGSRRIQDRLHVVTQYGFPAPSALREDAEFRRLIEQDYPQARAAMDDAAMARLASQIEARIRSAVADTPIAELLPEEQSGSAPPTTLACNAIQRPGVDTRLGMMMITSIDTDGSAQATLGTINNAWQLYGSAQNLYLLQSSGGWWFDEAQRQQTAIYRYAVGEGGALPGGVALADGWVDTSFQLSEFEGALRVAATEGRFVDGVAPFRQLNHLMVFDVASMEEIAAIRDFVSDKPQETIRAARFFGPRGFVVTFEFTDPLFAFDLSDPSAPLLAGAVEIPGFATYINALGDDFLLTIGRAGGEGGLGVGNRYQLRIFDVSDLAQPTPLAEEVPPLPADAYAYSLAEYEPLAFQFLPAAGQNAAGLLSIPAQISARTQQDALSGFVAYRIDAAQGAEAIREYARIDHKDAPSDGGDRCPPQRDALPPDGCQDFAPVIYNEPLRSVIAREEDGRTLLFTFSSAKLEVTDASGAAAVPLASLRYEE